VEVADAIWVVVDMERECRLTAEFRGRPRTLQHTGARRWVERQAGSPAAKHFMRHGPLQQFVRRLACIHGIHCSYRGSTGFFSVELEDCFNLLRLASYSAFVS